MNLFFTYLIFLYKYLNYLPYFIINALDLNIQKTFTCITACKRLVLCSTKDQEDYSGVIQQMRNEMWGSWIPSRAHFTVRSVEVKRAYFFKLFFKNLYGYCRMCNFLESSLFKIVCYRMELSNSSKQKKLRCMHSQISF